VGGRVVREFHVLGDTVNVAARLKARAGLDAIRADEATVREAGDRFGWTPLEALALKGKSRTVASAELIGVRGPCAVRTLVPEDPPAARLIGRDAERAALSDAIAALAGGRGGAIALLGEEGSGRSRLLADLATEPALAGIEVVVLHPTSEDAARGSAARDLVAALGGSSIDTTHPASVSAAVATALSAAARIRPLLVVIEDVERLDAESFAALAPALALATEGPVLFVVTAEASDAPLALQARALGERCREIRLGRLGRAEAERLVDALAPDDALAPEARVLYVSSLLPKTAPVLVMETATPTTAGGIWICKPGAQPRPMPIDGGPKIQGHGIGLYVEPSGEKRIFAVNHDDSGESVEP